MAEEIQTILDEIRPQVVLEVMAMLRVLHGADPGVVVSKSSTLLDKSEWFPVVSLSQFRTLVGGRYANLKLKWLGAGFPLRAHRGDRDEEATVDAEGWRALVEWIRHQGFEARLGLPEMGVLLELRKL